MKTSFITAVALIYFSLQGLSQDVTFPRQLTSQGSVLTVYQPQVESWVNHQKLVFRSAFSLIPNQGKQVVGVLYMSATTDVNMDSHRVFLSEMVIIESHFPSLDADKASQMDQLVRTFLTPGHTLITSVEQIVACTPKEDPTSTVAVNNDPPVIFVSKRPTILLQLEGAAITADASKDNLAYVINASYPLFLDKTNNTYYLFDGLEWQKAQATNGPWSFTGSLPKSLVNLAKDTNWSNLKGTIPAVSKPDKKMPAVFYSEKLAEIIVFDGEPAYKTIPGTSLKYASNTDSDIFLYTTNNQYYFLTSGRWFSSPGLNGPWTYATQNLPADFAKIPMNSPMANVLTSVPGTEQAKDAVMIAQIPTTIEVNPAEAAKQVNITYAGDPKFSPIETTGLSYAVNTSDKVIQVNPYQYYACVQGIWFVSTTPNGPWQTATTIPAAIYTIPPSSPVYNVTYVTQTVTSTGTVQASYTSGYMGVFVVGVSAGVIIASGTGYYHPPYYYYPPYGYPVCYGYPMTYGAYAYHPYPYGGVAYGASYNPYTGTYARSATAYGPYGSATGAQAYNPYTGTMARGASVSTAYGTTSAAQAYNPRTGASASTVQSSSPYGQWGSSTVSNGKGQTVNTQHNTTAQGTTASAKSSSGGAIAGASGPNNSGAIAKTSSGDMYASANGNVYKNTGNGWEDASKSSSGSGNANATSQASAAKSNAQAQSAASNAKASGATQGFNSEELNKASQDRERGNAQTQQFSNRASGFSGGGGGFQGRGGGGGGGYRRR